MTTLFQNQQVEETFQACPPEIKPKLIFLRKLVFDVAAESNEIGAIEEALKWGEASYLTSTGSTIRIGWKASKPDQYAMYFHCKTTLVETFRELYPEIFQFSGNRAIIFMLSEDLPVVELKHCIFLALTYHLRKTRPMLGATFTTAD